nr:immunoglobulin light chain junction region [Macaca mulatta]MOX42413.1 immunoglobulin light chain junction region [Macaca mulatta]MOX42563.1 immunoglobulin light chain junction region [Macaca mulatta]MOX43247.1 immunoglobulin light chain junction region [Macaca mulatta]MOX44376.1 immunoglobulin light chain junction region [Macaca mulatta]
DYYCMIWLNDVWVF